MVQDELIMSILSGGMDILDLRSGSVVKTLIPKVSEGIFDVIAEFNKTDDYVLYYHSGRKTIRAFRNAFSECCVITFF